MNAFLARLINTIRRYNYRNINYRLIIFVCLLTTIGIFAIASATTSSSYEKRQLVGFIFGLVVMCIMGLVDYKLLLRFRWALYALNLILLIVVLTPLGAERGGASRWINLGFTQIQPSEITKIVFIIFFATVFSKYKEKINNIKFLIMCTVLFIVPVFLILKEPDLSTTIVIILMFCSLLFMSGLSYKIIGILFSIAIPLFIIFIILILQPNQKILEDYQYDRIVGFYDEDSEDAAKIRYQQENSVMAIGSGGLFGKGLNNTTVTSVKNGNFISEPQTDFIFTIVGEEMGFVGTFAVIVLLVLIIFECFMTGARSPDFEGKLICFGYGSLIAFQSFVNIAVVTMLIPNTGLTLPFVSYGLSSLMTNFFAIGMVLNVGIQRSTKRAKLIGGYNEHRFDRT